jgi:hypothetical protein
MLWVSCKQCISVCIPLQGNPPPTTERADVLAMQDQGQEEMLVEESMSIEESMLIERCMPVFLAKLD